jgi:hypothetical protein
VEVDVWLYSSPEKMIAAGFYMGYDSTRIDVISVETYDSSTLPGPWDPSFSQIIPNPNGPGTYLVLVNKFVGILPDAYGDIVIAKVRLRLTEPLQTNIIFSTIPEVDIVIDEFGTFYDPEIDPKTVTIDVQ